MPINLPRFFLPIALFVGALAFSLGMRALSLNTPYFCWDEHDYIAHNIYHKLVIQGFEIPFSNKWPLGHALIYFLTKGCDPFQIISYRIVTTALDSVTAVLLGFLVCPQRDPKRNLWAVVALFSAALSIPLRSSAGILAESLANPFLAIGALCLQGCRSSSLGGIGSVISFACACWIKPTAVFPGLLMAGSFLWPHRKNWRPVLFFCGTVLVCSFISLLVFGFNNSFGSGYFLPSALQYNFSSSHFGLRPMKAYLDVFFTGVSFFEFSFPWLIFCLLLLHERFLQTHHILPLFWLAGAFLNLGIRPAGAQTAYWLYVLPPMLWLGWLGWTSFSSGYSLTKRYIVSGFMLIPVAYGWMVNLVGPPLGLHPGGRGGIRQIQTQVADLQPALEALRSHPRYRETKSRLLLWGMPWQVFYLGRCIPATSLLTSESWAYGIGLEKQKRWVASGLTNADFIWLDNGPGAIDIKALLSGKFAPFYQAGGRTLYARIN